MSTESTRPATASTAGSIATGTGARTPGATAAGIGTCSTVAATAAGIETRTTGATGAIGASTGAGRQGRRRRGAASALAALAGAAALALGACGDDDGSEASAERQAEVAERGASVMPFDLDATSHLFEPRPDGLVQTVVVDDPGDTDQVALVRQHLTEEAGRFTAGDYGDPSTIHGDDMPGLAALSAGADGIDVEYADLDDGARITFTTDDPALVDALHQWSEAQVSDHGDDAEHVDHDGDDGSS